MTYFAARSSPNFVWLLPVLVTSLAIAGVNGALLYPAVAQAKAQEESTSNAKVGTGTAVDSASRLEVDIASRLEYAETVNIRIPGNRALTGEYRLGPDGTIALPGIGRLPVSKLSVTEFEHLLKSEIFRLSNRESNVAIEIERYRSIYVSGAVLRTGAFPWKPGLSVLQAEALAGGPSSSRSLLNGGQIISNPLSSRHEKERISRSAYDLAAALATIERLRTEKKGGSVFITPEWVSKLVGPKELDRLVARQQALLTSRKAAYDVKVQALQNSMTLAAEQQNAMQMQRIRLKEQLASRNTLKARVTRMAKEGYSRADRVFEEQVRIAQLEERLTTTTLGITTMKMAEATAKQKLETLITSRQAEIDLELLDLEQKVSRLEIRLKNAKKLGHIAGKDSELKLTEAEVDFRPEYEIVRIELGRSVLLKADRTTSLHPGDVLVVNLKD